MVWKLNQKQFLDKLKSDSNYIQREERKNCAHVKKIDPIGGVTLICLDLKCIGRKVLMRKWSEDIIVWHENCNFPEAKKATAKRFLTLYNREKGLSSRLIWLDPKFPGLGGGKSEKKRFSTAPHLTEPFLSPLSRPSCLLLKLVMVALMICILETLGHNFDIFRPRLAKHVLSLPNLIPALIRSAQFLCQYFYPSTYRPKFR